MNRGELYAKITQMRQSAVTISRSASRVRDSMDAIDSEVQALGTDRFMSIGAESFRTEYNRITPQLREAFETIMQFHGKLNAAADDIEVASRLSK